jgi:hypothetical protein
MSRYRRQVRQALAENTARKRQESIMAAAGRARLRGLTRVPKEQPAEKELVRLDDDGNVRALLATAPVVEDTETPPVTDVPEQPAPADRTPSDQVLDPPENGVPFTIPAVLLEGFETGDGRYITPGTVGRRDLPMTLMGMLRNPDGGWGHDAAIVIGRVDTLERVDFSAEINRLTGQPYGPDVWAWKATGFLTPHPDQEGSEATVQYVKDQVLRGVSVDFDEFEAHEEILAVDEEGWPTDWRLIIDSASIGTMTVCPFAAFAGATIVLDGEALADPGAEPADGAVPPAAVASAGQPGVLTFRGTSCVACDSAALTASAAAPTTEELAAGVAPTYPPASWFSRQPSHDQPMDRHVYVGRSADGTPTGQVWGRVAWWDVCHSGVGDACVMAPKLGDSGYEGFHTRGRVYTAEGEELGVGILTHGGGHANIRLGVTPALAHYDTAGAAYCKVRCGEDEDGIWFAGTFRPGVTREQVEDFAAFPVSGDWRADAGDRDVRFIAAVSVNTPGFSPPRAQMALAASGQRALVAAGSVGVTRRAAAGGTDPGAVRREVERLLRPVLASAARTRLRELTRPRG